MKKIICALLSMTLVLSSSMGSFAATGTQGTSATKAAASKSTATVMPAPTEAQVKLFMDQYYKYTLEGNLKELEKLAVLTEADREYVKYFQDLLKGYESLDMKVLSKVASAKLITVVKKGSTYVYLYSAQMVVLTNVNYEFTEIKGEVTVAWNGKSLKLINCGPETITKMPDPKKSIIHTKALQIAENYGTTYVEALKQGIQPPMDYSNASYINLTIQGQPMPLTLTNAEIMDQKIKVSPKKGEKNAISIDLKDFQSKFDELAIRFNLGEGKSPIKIKAFADGVLVETFNVSDLETIQYRILDEQVVTFEIEAEEDFEITLFELYKLE